MSNYEYSIEKSDRLIYYFISLIFYNDDYPDSCFIFDNHMNICYVGISLALALLCILSCTIPLLIWYLMVKHRIC